MGMLFINLLKPIIQFMIIFIIILCLKAIITKKYIKKHVITIQSIVSIVLLISYIIIYEKILYPGDSGFGLLALLLYLLGMLAAMLITNLIILIVKLITNKQYRNDIKSYVIKLLNKKM